MIEAIFLYVFLFGEPSMRAEILHGGIGGCYREMAQRSKEFDDNFARLPKGIGLSYGVRTVYRGDITMDCRIEIKSRDLPGLRGPLG